MPGNETMKRWHVFVPRMTTKNGVPWYWDVKTTTGCIDAPFSLSDYEVQLARLQSHYCIARVSSGSAFHGMARGHARIQRMQRSRRAGGYGMLYLLLRPICNGQYVGTYSRVAKEPGIIELGIIACVSSRRQIWAGDVRHVFSDHNRMQCTCNVRSTGRETRCLFLILSHCAVADFAPFASQPQSGPAVATPVARGDKAGRPCRPPLCANMFLIKANRIAAILNEGHFLGSCRIRPDEKVMLPRRPHPVEGKGEAAALQGHADGQGTP